MGKLKGLLLLASLTMSLNMHGEILYGPTDLTSKSYESLIVNGPATLKLIQAHSIDIKSSLRFQNLDVEGLAKIFGGMKGDRGKFGQLNVVGPLEANHVICDDLVVRGSVKISFFDVRQHADIDGPLEVKQSKFKTLIAKSDKMTFDQVEVGSLKVPKSEEAQILILNGKTVVNGDIIFESGKGEIYIKSPEVVIKGSVKGASVNK